MKLILELDEKTIKIIEEMKTLNSFVNEREYEASMESKKIDYSNFTEYKRLHDWNGDLGCNLANAGRLELGLTI